MQPRWPVLDCTSCRRRARPRPKTAIPSTACGESWPTNSARQEAYDIVREAARQGTAPAGQLDELFRQVGPCVILIDELVADIRDTGNAIDSNYTFVQNLTQAARRSGRVSLVITLPEHAVEAGGELGAEVLARLDNILGRIEATSGAHSKSTRHSSLSAAGCSALSWTGRSGTALARPSPPCTAATARTTPRCRRTALPAAHEALGSHTS